MEELLGRLRDYGAGKEGVAPHLKKLVRDAELKENLRALGYAE